MAALRLCLESGCKNLTRGKSRCPDHKHQAWQGSTWTRPPGWEATRKRVLLEEPGCRRCGAKATDVDHIRQQIDGGTEERANLQALCNPCHLSKTGGGGHRV